MNEHTTISTDNSLPGEEHRKQLVKRFQENDPLEQINDRILIIDLNDEKYQEIQYLLNQIKKYCTKGLKANEIEDKDTYFHKIEGLVGNQT